MTTTRLSAYCFHNWSKNENIIIQIYADKTAKWAGFDKATYKLSPKGGKSCRNWKIIDKNNRKKQWRWVAYTKNYNRKLGEGRFPIGGAVYFSGYDEDGYAKFSIYFGPDPKSMPAWEYWKSPWNHKSPPWETNNKFDQYKKRKPKLKRK